MENPQIEPSKSLKAHWFRAKKYGFGWVPVTWQGWGITLAYTVLVVSSAVNFTQIAATSPDAFGSNFDSDMLVFRFVIWILSLTIFLLWICYKTGDQASWHWGDK